tara:strand:+ start:217 stop:579 length:363 start_codon:yes stop_codon:yes gene_type:complete
MAMPARREMFAKGGGAALLRPWIAATITLAPTMHAMWRQDARRFPIPTLVTMGTYVPWVIPAAMEVVWPEASPWFATMVSIVTVKRAARPRKDACLGRLPPMMTDLSVPRRCVTKRRMRL